MAVKDYSRHHQFRLATLFIVFHLVGFAALGLWSNYALSHFSVSPFVLVGVPLIVVEAIIGYVVITTATKPIKEIVSALQYAYRNAKTNEEEMGNLPTLAAAIRRLDAQKNPDNGVVSEQAFASSLLEHIPLGIIVLNAKRNIIYANPAAPMHGGGKQLNIDFDVSNSLDSWLDTIEGSVVTATHWWRRMRQEHIEDEAQRQFFDVLAIYHQDNTDGLEIILATIDRTEEYGVDEDDLDFTALAAHELRGPITVIKGYLDVLRQELGSTLSSDQKAFFERLDVSADRLSTYINNILNVARFDRRHMQLHLKEEQLSRVYGLIADDLELRARTNHRLLNVDLPESLPTVAADRSSLSEVIINLVDNAIKYSSEGGLIIVTASVKGDFVEVSVQDNGIGIPGSIIEHVFDKFYRSHRSRENTVGTGLGLYITKAIVESHGGSISAKSVEGHGSAFAFTVPIYATVADKLLGSDNKNTDMIKPKKYIKNHTMYRG